MLKSVIPGLAFLLGTCLFGNTVHAQTVHLIEPGKDDRIAKIEGLVLDGASYDLTFQHGVAFKDLKGTKLTLKSEKAADAALFAIAKAVKSTEAKSSTRTVNVVIPIQVIAQVLLTQEGNNGKTTEYSRWYAERTGVNGRSTDGALKPSDAFVTFSKSAAK